MGWPPCAFGKGFVPAIVVRGCCVRVSAGNTNRTSICAYFLWCECLGLTVVTYLYPACAPSEVNGRRWRSKLAAGPSAGIAELKWASLSMKVENQSLPRANHK